jgi:hypothetical protein
VVLSSVTGAQGRRLRARDLGPISVGLDDDQVALLRAALRKFIERKGAIAMTRS